MYKGKPYVIAITPFDSPYFFLQGNQAILRVLYGFDRYIAIDWDHETRDVLDAVFMDEIQNNESSNVPLGYFTNREHSHVSAVIFSLVATFSKVRVLSKDPRPSIVFYKKYNDYGTYPIIGAIERSNYHEHLLDGLMVFHNPYADIPFEVEEFYHQKIAHYEMLADIPHCFLFSRNIITFINDNPLIAELLRAEFSKDIIKKATFPKFHF